MQDSHYLEIYYELDRYCNSFCNEPAQTKTNKLTSFLKHTTHDKELRKEKKDVEEITSLSNFLFFSFSYDF